MRLPLTHRAPSFAALALLAACRAPVAAQRPVAVVVPPPVVRVARAPVAEDRAPVVEHLAPVVEHLAPVATSRLELGFHGGCASFPSGRMSCWGDGRFMAPPAEFDEHAPRSLSGDGPGCAVAEDGTLRCWWGARSTGEQVACWAPPGEHYRQVAVRWRMACAMERVGRVTCWELRLQHQQGARAQLMSSGGVAMDNRGSVVCVLDARQVVRCWELIPLMDGEAPHGPIAFAVDPSEPAQQFTRVVVWGRYVCALSARGGLWCSESINDLHTNPLPGTQLLRRVLADGSALDVDVDANDHNAPLCIIDPSRMLRCAPDWYQPLTPERLAAVAPEVPASTELRCGAGMCCVLQAEQVFCTEPNPDPFALPLPRWVRVVPSLPAGP